MAPNGQRSSKDWLFYVDVPNYSRLCLLIAAFVGVFLLDAATIATISYSEEIPKFVAFVDGGSTGSRLHTFETISRNPGTSFLIAPAGPSKKMNTALASLEGKAVEEVAAAIEPLVNAAKARIPEEHQPQTPFFVWGTAGMRTMNEIAQRSVYNRVYRAVVGSSQFRVNRSHFQTISGKEEGFYGWLAANYVHGINVPASLIKGKVTNTVGALDVGGASAQAVYLPPPRTSFTNLEVLEDSLFIESWLGYGAHHMDMLLKNFLVANAPSESLTIDNPCSFTGTKEPVVSRTLTGTGSFTQCLHLIQQQLEAKTKTGKPMTLPPEALQLEFWGMSLLFHATNFLHIVVPSMPFPRPSINDISEAGATLCSTQWTHLVQEYDGKDPNTPRKRMFGRCFDAALTVALLGKPFGWGFPVDSRRVRMVQNISNLEVEWSLGAAVATISGQQYRHNRAALVQRRRSWWLMSFSLLLILVYVAYNCCPWRTKWDVSPRWRTREQAMACVVEPSGTPSPNHAP